MYSNIRYHSFSYCQYLTPIVAQRPDGYAKAKVFNIVPSAQADFTFSCYQGKGNSDTTGKIRMEKIEDRIIVPISAEQLKGLLLFTMSAWRAYKLAQSVALERMQLDHFYVKNKCD